MFMNKKGMCAVIMVSVLGVGCASTREAVPNEVSSVEAISKDIDYLLVATNLVGVLGSMESINPLNTTFQMLEPSTEFGRAIYRTVESDGYGIQLVDSDVGRDFLRYKAEKSQTESGDIESYSISVGDTTVSREYNLKNGITQPITPVVVSTSEEVYDEIDDSIFGTLPNPSVTSVIGVDYGVPEVIVSESTSERIDNAPGLTNNVYTIQESNYSSLFEDYYDVESQTIIFPNESLVLGRKNKSILEAIASRVNPETDIISVIGCSHGRTKINNGNQLLADGRAYRVTESLLFAGVERDVILDEACWANAYWDEEAPRRGVMITHKRELNKG